MLRIGRSNPRYEWHSSDTNVKSSMDKDLEGAQLLRGLPHNSRKKLTDVYSSSFALKTTLFIAMLVYLFSIPLKYKKEDDKQIQWETPTIGYELDATLMPLSDVNSSPAGRALSASSLKNTPRIDGKKLYHCLAKLEGQLPDEDLNEDADGMDSDIGQTYGLGQRPPLISHIPSLSSHHHEEYTVETADALFCSATPCKVLLPVWTRPLTTIQQMTQMQSLIHLSKLLDRTLVLPNTGQVASDGGETLLGLGTCQHYPFSRYFDASRLLFTPRQAASRHLKPAVLTQPFLEWSKYRPTRPTAQVVVIDSTPFSGNYDPSFTLEGAEIRIDEYGEKGRGKRKNCLSSRAPKLKFQDRPTFVISPGRQSTKEARAGDASSAGDGLTNVSAAYIRGILAFLSLTTGTLNETSCSNTSFGSCSAVNQYLALGDPDVLVIEWDLDPEEALYAFENTSSIVEESSLLDYSSRLYTLATRILSTLQRPLVMIRSKTTSSDYNFVYSDVVQLDFDELSIALEGFIQSENQSLTAESHFATHMAAAAKERFDFDVLGNDLSINDTGTRAGRKPANILGTLWLDNRISRDTRWINISDSNRSKDTIACNNEDEMRGTESLELSEGATNTFSFGGLQGVNISSALALLGSKSPTGLLLLPKPGILEDDIILHILEDIVEKHADRVFLIQDRRATQVEH